MNDTQRKTLLLLIAWAAKHREAQSSPSETIGAYAADRRQFEQRLALERHLRDLDAVQMGELMAGVDDLAAGKAHPPRCLARVAAMDAPSRPCLAWLVESGLCPDRAQHIGDGGEQ